MEKFYELSIKSEESALHKLIAPVMIISLFFAAGIFMFVGLIPALIFLLIICLPLFIAKRLSMVEYDYEFTDGELEISAIYERVRRKVKGNINLREVEIVAPLGNSELKRYSNAKVKKCYNKVQNDKKVYVIVVRWETKMVAYEVLINQKMLDLFFFSNPQKVIR
ncbi:hypothetical protein [Clostridium sp. LIBA-8841]|uniref:hypothetical protein n=1 Tax=Clostridium sp. LIBA-8841 TaxID=2987530 RepID=UPI002AC6BE57|nr:hypothetical protein [Clostridium sp. LIBA-8841]MDZ5252415.1 hypothetical protein [Clostridium sp. LIBA-8841]